MKTYLVFASRRSAALFVLAALACMLFLLHSASQATASGVYTGGSLGYDISSPQCGGAYPSAPFDFGIVGVNNGRAFRHNSCLGSEFTWATGHTIAPSLYMNLNYAVGSTAPSNISSPKTCAKGDKACQSYNYGWNAAADAVSYAASQGASSNNWWIDVETSNSWSAKPNLNVQDIQGAIDYLQNQGATVGFYSTPSMWNSITGGYNFALPVWVPGASSAQDAPSHCADSYAFNGGKVSLVQYQSSGFDTNYACP